MLLIPISGGVRRTQIFLDLPVDNEGLAVAIIRFGR